MKHLFGILLVTSLFISPANTLAGMSDVVPLIKEVVQPYRACAAHASDYAEFCPNAPSDEVCLGSIVAAIVELESGGNANNRFDESQYTPGMKESVGLMQLSTGECAEGDNLTNPKLNLTCGVRKFCQLVNKDNVIAKGKSGAAAYWSVLREPANLSGANGGIISVGKRAKIIKLVPTYYNQFQ